MDEKDAVEAVTKGFIKGAFDSCLELIKGKKGTSNTNSDNEDIKKRTRVLFIDDEPFEYIEVLKSSGWDVSQIEEVHDIDDVHISRANIIFLDYLGVGNILTPKEKGLGLLDAIKKKYPEKIIIFCSAHTGFGLEDNKLKLADDWVPKSSDAIVYIQKIEEWSKKANE